MPVSYRKRRYIGEANRYVVVDANGNKYSVCAYTAADAIIQARLRVPWVIKNIRPFMRRSDRLIIDVFDFDKENIPEDFFKKLE